MDLTNIIPGLWNDEFNGIACFQIGSDISCLRVPISPWHIGKRQATVNTPSAGKDSL